MSDLNGMSDLKNGIIPQPPNDPNKISVIRCSSPTTFALWSDILAELAEWASDHAHVTVDDKGNLLTYSKLSDEEAKFLGIPDAREVWIAFAFKLGD